MNQGLKSEQTFEGLVFKGSKNMYVESEEEIFNFLGMQYLEPHQRNY